MSVLKTAFGVVVMLMAAALAAAEEPPVPQLTPEHEALAAWVGSWAGEGELKPGPFGPGGKVTWTEECSFFEGSHFHVVCRSDGSGPMGEMKGLGIIGYSTAKGAYTHYGVDSTGWSGYSEGTRDGDSWTFTGKEVMGDTTYHTRMDMVMDSPESISFSWAMSEDGSEWMVLMEGATTKK